MEWLVLIAGTLLIAVLVGAAFSLGGVRGPGESLGWFLAILFLGSLAFGSWVDPVGPVTYGFPWVSFLVIAIFLALLVAASSPSNRETRRRVKELPLDSNRDREPETQPAPVDPRSSAEGAGAATAVSLFFWIFVVVAIAIVLIRGFVSGP